jgi:hypothetical protein
MPSLLPMSKDNSLLCQCMTCFRSDQLRLTENEFNGTERAVGRYRGRRNSVVVDSRPPLAPADLAERGHFLAIIRSILLGAGFVPRLPQSPLGVPLASPTSVGLFFSRSEYQVSIADFSVWAKAGRFFYRKQVGLGFMEKIVILCLLMGVIGIIAATSPPQQ